MSEFDSMTISSAAIETLGALFVHGPLWDGDVPSKTARDELVRRGLAFRHNGWQSLTKEGLDLAITADVRNRRDQR